MKNLNLKTIAALIVTNLATAALVWIYKPEPKPQTTNIATEQQVRYIDRTITKDGVIVHETIKEVIDKASMVTKIEQPNYLIGVQANFNRDLRWDYTLTFGKRMWEQTYVTGGVTVDSRMSPQAIHVGIISTFRSLPFIE